ncbi:MAG: hypothetical protein K0S28_1520 [Paucimonas sp.]|jgi:hypothetical protein|nr:hypothetical protein [Paucimonas sp.]
MSKPITERRGNSQAALVDSATRVLGQLANHTDLQVRSLVMQVLGDLRQLRRQIPSRRSTDYKPR